MAYRKEVNGLIVANYQELRDELAYIRRKLKRQDAEIKRLSHNTDRHEAMLTLKMQVPNFQKPIPEFEESVSEESC